MRNGRTEVVRERSGLTPVRFVGWAVLGAMALAGCRSSTSPGGPVLRSIDVTPAKASIPSGGDQPFVATGRYSDGTAAPLPLARWSSSSVSSATVDDGVGLAHGLAAGGPITVTATDEATGVSGTALLTVTDAVLRTLVVSPRVAAVTAGSSQPFEVVGQLSDGSSRNLTASVTWRSSDGGLADVDAAGVAHGLAAGGPVTLTATDPASGLSATASLTVLDPAVLQSTAASSLAGTLGASGAALYQVNGLDPAVEVLVRVATPGPPAAPVGVQVDADASFTAIRCRTYAGGPPCRAGAPSASGQLFVRIDGPAGAPFGVEVAPLPVLHPGGPAASGFVGTETYYEIVGATAGAVEVTLSGLGDVFADLFVYDGPRGPFGSGLLCSTVRSSPLPTKSCVAAASGPIYVTVEGWLTAAGTEYALGVAPF
jgi:hypothetical protein